MKCHVDFLFVLAAVCSNLPGKRFDNVDNQFPPPWLGECPDKQKVEMRSHFFGEFR